MKSINLRILVEPSFLDQNINVYLLQKAKKILTNRCYKSHGFIKEVVSIDRGTGIIDHSGRVVYDVTVFCRLLKIPNSLKTTVVSSSNLITHSSKGPIHCFFPSPNQLEQGSKVTVKILRSKMISGDDVITASACLD